MSKVVRSTLALAVVVSGLLLGSCIPPLPEVFSLDALFECEGMSCGCGWLAAPSGEVDSIQHPSGHITHYYEEGHAGTLTAGGVAGWAFSHWTGDVTGTSPSVDIIMDSDKTVTAHFEQIPPLHSLQIVVIGEGRADCVCCPQSGQFGHGDIIAVAAYPDPGWVFGHWAGGAHGTEPRVDLVMDGDVFLTAFFVRE
jgi:uncharacterized repeat protein (TIGR02543 family)